jgi:hypothetical protein
LRTRVPASAVLGLLVFAAACNRLHGVPTGRGWSAYRVGGLTLELPEDWSAKGDAVRLTAVSPDGLAKVEAERVERTFASGAECLSRAERSLSRGAAELERARHHPTRLGDRAAVALEADLRGWHGWAWAACDGREQYRLSFFGASPMTPEAVSAQRGLEASVRFEGRP